MVRGIPPAEHPSRCNILLQSLDEHNFYLSSKLLYNVLSRKPSIWH
jgi:hypothetical protein